MNKLLGNRKMDFKQMRERLLGLGVIARVQAENVSDEKDVMTWKKAYGILFELQLILGRREEEKSQIIGE
mgnify:CR=1 FL=1